MASFARALALLAIPSFVWLSACQSHRGLYPLEGGGGSTSTTSTQTGGGGSTGSTTSAAGGGGSGGGATTSSSSTITTSSSSSTSSSTSSNSGTGGSSSSSSGGGSGGGGSNPGRMRVVAANLTSGTSQTYDGGHGIRILQGIKGDVILMQEMNYLGNSTTALRQLADQVCGTECAYNRGGGTIPNGVVSRYPILASGVWVDPKTATRDFTWARIDVPGPVDLWAVSLHLLTSNPTERNAEATALIGFLQANVPVTDYLVVAGDLNTDNRGEVAISTLSARLSTVGPYPKDGDGNDNTSGPRSRPYDWNLASAELRMRETPVEIGAQSFFTGLVVDTRVYTPIADLAPALVTDSGASNMQHMAVVRDYVLLP